MLSSNANSWACYYMPYFGHSPWINFDSYKAQTCIPHWSRYTMRWGSVNELAENCFPGKELKHRKSKFCPGPILMMWNGLLNLLCGFQKRWQMTGLPDRKSRPLENIQFVTAATVRTRALRYMFAPCVTEQASADCQSSLDFSLISLPERKFLRKAVIMNTIIAEDRSQMAIRVVQSSEFLML